MFLVAAGGSAHAEEPAAASSTQTNGAVVAADFGTTMLLQDPDRSFGLGLDGRVGYTFAGLPAVTPELSLGFVDFPDAEVFGRASGGARLTLGTALQASLFGHAGGWWNEVDGGPAGDLGLAVDFALPRGLYAGVQGAYNIAWVELEDGYTGVPYASMGVHVAWAPRAEPARAAPIAKAARR